MESEEYLTPEREDEQGFVFPSKPSELRTLPDDKLFRLWRKLAYGGQWRFDRRLGGSRVSIRRPPPGRLDSGHR